LQTYLPLPGQHRIYFDFGTEGLDAQYEPHQRRIDQLMAEKGHGFSLVRKVPKESGH